MKSYAAAIPDRAASSVRSSSAAARSPASRASCASASAASRAVPASSRRRSAASGSPPRPSLTSRPPRQRRLRPRDRRGQLGAGQQPGLRQVRLDLRTRLDQPVRGLGQLGFQPPDPVEQRPGLRDRVLRGARRHRRRGALAGRSSVPASSISVRATSSSAGPARCCRRPAPAPTRRSGRAARPAPRRPGHAAGRRVQLRLEARQHLGQVLLQVAQPVEGGRLGVEALVRGAAQAQDLAEQVRAGSAFVRLLVVDALAEREGLHQLGARLLQRGAELRHCLVAELDLREAELVLGGLHGVVELDQRVAGVVGEILGRLAGSRIGSAGGAGAVSACSGLGPTPPPREHVRPATDQRDPADDAARPAGPHRPRRRPSRPTRRRCAARRRARSPRRPSRSRRVAGGRRGSRCP